MAKKTLPIMLRLNQGDKLPILLWSPIGVHFYAFLGKLGFHIAHMDDKTEFCLSIYVHTPNLRDLYWKQNIPSVGDAMQVAAEWLQEQERFQLEHFINDGDSER